MDKGLPTPCLQIVEEPVEVKICGVAGGIRVIEVRKYRECLCEGMPVPYRPQNIEMGSHNACFVSAADNEAAEFELSLAVRFLRSPWSRSSSTMPRGIGARLRDVPATKKASR